MAGARSFGASLGAVLALLLTAAAAAAAPVPANVAVAPASALLGDWDGSLMAGAMKFRLALHVRAAAGGLTAGLDSIDQGVNGLPVSGLSLDRGAVIFAIAPIKAAFNGQLSTDGATITGTWTQGPAALPLVFHRRAPGAAAPALVRPQEPKPPWPYRSLEVTFPSPQAHARLAGTLTEPNGSGPFPAVVLIAGSGPNNRDEAILGHKPFLLLADNLTRRGVAVLRYDKRGTGASGGDYKTATSRDFAADAAAAVAFLRARPEIKRGEIGLIGHSEGGLIAPIVAARDPKIAFVVLMAPPGVDGAAILIAQGRAIGVAGGVPAAKLDAALALNARLFAAVEQAKDTAAAKQAVEQAMTTAPGPATPPPAARAAAAAALATPWMRFFLTYDPAPALRRLRMPVLAMWGSKDLQVPPAQNFGPVSAALAGDGRAREIVLPGLNHLFQKATTGSPTEYGTIEETLDPSALAAIDAFVAAQTRR